MTRQAYILKDHELVVFWAQKAACTSITSAVGSNVLGLEPVPDQRLKGGMMQRLRGMGLVAPGNRARRIAQKHHFRTLALVRDPYDRLVSSFISKFVVRRGVALNDPERYERFSREFYQRALDSGVVDRKAERIAFAGLTFTEFVGLVCDQIDRRRWWMQKPDPHWNTQIPQEFVAAGFDYDHLFDFQDAGLFFQKLAELSHCRIPARKLNPSPFQGPPQGDQTKIKSRMLSEMEGFSRQDFWSPALAARIKTSFATDYHYLAICRNQAK